MIRRLVRKTGRILLSLADRGLPPPPRGWYQDDIPARDLVLVDMLARLRGGSPWLDVIRDARAAKHGERIAEYTFIADFVRRRNLDRILDVGCVLNNPIIDPEIPASCQISFLNPASEPICRTRAVYHKMPMEEFRPASPFPLVTCLSTLEHVGFDNTRYGTDLMDEGWNGPTAVVKLVEMVERLTHWVEGGGTLLVSCPYGQPEYVRLPPATGVRTSQVLNRAHVDALSAHPVLRSAQIRLLRLRGSGWEEVGADAEFEPYGSVGPGAAGLLLLAWEAAGH